WAGRALPPGSQGMCRAGPAPPIRFTWGGAVRDAPSCPVRVSVRPGSAGVACAVGALAAGAGAVRARTAGRGARPRRATDPAGFVTGFVTNEERDAAGQPGRSDLGGAGGIAPRARFPEGGGGRVRAEAAVQRALRAPPLLLAHPAGPLGRRDLHQPQ